MIRESDKNNISLYRKDTDFFEKEFPAICFLLIKRFLEFDPSLINPAEVLINIASTVIMPKNAAKSVKNTHRTG